MASSETDHVTRVCQLERFALEPRYTLLILAGLESLAGLQLPPGSKHSYTSGQSIRYIFLGFFSKQSATFAMDSARTIGY